MKADDEKGDDKLEKQNQKNIVKKQKKKLHKELNKNENAIKRLKERNNFYEIFTRETLKKRN